MLAYQAEMFQQSCASKIVYKISPFKKSWRLWNQSEVNFIKLFPSNLRP